tara:strand:- start:19800 stop:20222 length:423 start_codon:yes stop_codon:yes gene_type:complete
MGAEILAALTATGNTISSVLKPVTTFLGGADTATSATQGINEGLRGLLGNMPSPEAAAAIEGVGKGLGQISGIGGQALKAVPVGTAIASVASKPKAPKVKLPSGPTDTAIARASTRSQTRGPGGGKRAKPKAGYSSFGTA